WRKRIVVGSARRNLVRIGRREMVGGQCLARRRLPRLRIHARNFGLPLVGDRLDLRLAVAELVKVIEGDVRQAVAGRADLLVNLEATLKLLLVEPAEGAVARQVKR